MEDAFWQADAEAASRMQADFEAKLTGLQRTADEGVATIRSAELAITGLRAENDALRDDGIKRLEARLRHVETQNAIMRLEILRRDNDDAMRDSEARMAELRERHREIADLRASAEEGLDAQGGWTEAEPSPSPQGTRRTGRAKANSTRERKSRGASYARHLATAKAILARLGITMVEGGHLVGDTRSTGANDSLVRLVRRWKEVGAEAVLTCLRDNVRQKRDPIALSTIAIRGVADLEPAWAGHAGSTWFLETLTGLDFRAIHEDVMAVENATARGRYVLSRSSMPSGGATPTEA